MLRNRSRAVTGKQALMADHTSQSSSSSSSSYTKPVKNSFFIGSPRFRALPLNYNNNIDHSLISPTSVLDSKPFFSLQNPLSNYDHQKLTKPTTKNNNNNSPSKSSILSGNKQKFFPFPSPNPNPPIGLALIDDKHDSKPSKSVIFSAKLRVQIPPPPPPDSAVDGGGGGGDGGGGGIRKGGVFSPGEIGNGLMTVKEMEVCEEYTCVRRHGPNAKITHIFDNFVVKSFVDSGHSENFSMADLETKTKMKKKKNDFLSFCYTCKNNLELTNDIYIYRGEKAFCSHECRYQEMVLDEEEEEDSF